MGGVRTAFSRWDVGEAPAGGVSIPFVSDHWATHFESRFAGVRKINEPRFTGTVWAAVFDLRWQFVALHRYMMHLPDAAHWSFMVPYDVVHKEWEIEHRDDPALQAERRASWKDSAAWFAGEMLKNPDFMEARFEKTPLWDMMPLETWEPILAEVAAGRWGVSPEERVNGLRSTIFRFGYSYPQTIRGTDPEAVVECCGRVLTAAREIGVFEYAGLFADEWEMGAGEGEQVGNVAERERVWLQECREKLIQPRWRVWL
jgi:hypothetical protein